MQNTLQSASSYAVICVKSHAEMTQIARLSAIVHFIKFNVQHSIYKEKVIASHNIQCSNFNIQRKKSQGVLLSSELLGTVI